MPFGLFRSRRCSIWQIIGILWLAFATAAPILSVDKAVAADETKLLHQVDLLIDRGGYAVQKAGQTIYARQPKQPFVPASIMKIITAQAALHILGPEYRFKTRFYKNQHNDLFIQGTGDPFLISEEVAGIIDQFIMLGINEIRDIVLDDTAFYLPVRADGVGASDNPYDAANSALAVNFNTVHITKDASGRVDSAEPQTPYVPLMAELAQKLPAGTYRLNISTDINASERQSLLYAGQLFRALQREKKIAGRGAIRPGHVPDGLRPFYIHVSGVSVQEAIESLMRYSNNFIANQLFLACGASRLGYPATWEKGRSVLRDFLHKELNFTEQEVTMIEGSGLSRANRVTPAAMLTVLDAFKPHAFLLRYLNEEKRRILAKSGTLTGVYSYAGYFLNDGQPDGFIIILNQKENNRDRILDLLERLYRQWP